MEFPTVMNWASSMPTLGLLGGIFILFIFFLKNLFANIGGPDQTPRFAASGPVLHSLPMSQKRALGLYG